MVRVMETEIKLTEEQLKEIQEHIIKYLPLMFTPEVIAETERIKAEHAIEWERIKFRPFTI